jgi:Ras-related protein Rab-2A
MNYENNKYAFKYILIGNSGVGKSSIVQRFTDDKILSNMMTTVGVDFKVKHVITDNTKIKIYIWDTAGQESFQSIISLYYKNVIGALLCYDIGDIDTFNNLDEWLNNIRQNSPLNTTIILIGNKKDTNCRQVTYEQGKKYAEMNGLLFIEIMTNNPEDYSVNYAFMKLTNEIHKKIQTGEVDPDTDAGISQFKLRNEPNQKSDNIVYNCCIIN